MKKRIGMIMAACLLSFTMTGCATQIDKGKSLLEEGKYEQAAETFEKASKDSDM